MAFKRTDTLYKNMLRLFPNSPILLRAYAHFLSEMNCDYDTAELLNSWAFELEVTKTQVWKVYYTLHTCVLKTKNAGLKRIYSQRRIFERPRFTCHWSAPPIQKDGDCILFPPPSLPFSPFPPFLPLFLWLISVIWILFQLQSCEVPLYTPRPLATSPRDLSLNDVLVYKFAFFGLQTKCVLFTLVGCSVAHGGEDLAWCARTTHVSRG